MKVAELTGAELDLWVAKAEGLSIQTMHGMPSLVCADPEAFRSPDRYSSKWKYGGPLIERERIELHCLSRSGGFLGEWMARITPVPLSFGPTPLIAAMRAYVASKFGAEIVEKT